MYGLKKHTLYTNMVIVFLVGGFHHHTGPYGVMGFYANFFDDGERITIGQPG